jgi:ATP-binding cassette subfamily F protein 3
MIDVVNLNKSIAGRPLLTDVSFKLAAGECVSLAGVNGSGKSTLLKLCAGESNPDEGHVSKPRDLSIGYLPQHADFKSGRNVIEELRHVFEEVLGQESELDHLAGEMSRLDPDTDAYVKVADRFGFIQHELDRLNIYEMDAVISRIAAGLGFQHADLNRPCLELSGGWRMRIMLARLLLHNHGLLLLDEPTNHLDLETMLWLEDWIQSSDCTVLMVSHEQAFMDRLSSRIFEIHEGKLSIYRANYSEYLEQRRERWAQWEREYQNQQDELSRTERFIERFRYKATKAVQVQSRIKQLEKMVMILPPPREPASIHFKFPAADRGSKEVYLLKDLKMSFGDLSVLEQVDLDIWRGDRIALVGLNGAGKSTLIKLLAGLYQPVSGTLRTGPLVSTEYFAQYDTEDISPENKVLDEVNSAAPQGMEQHVRNLLGSFFFTGDDVNKPIKVLSGGERTRVRLARMLFTGANTLLLDEPTNHLDLASRRTLEQAIQDYSGTVIFVSHDRVFLDRIPNRIIEIKNCQVRCFKGNYGDYCHALANLGEDSPLVDSHRDSTRKTFRNSPSNRVQSGRSKSEEHDTRKAVQKDLTRTRTRLRKLESEIGGLEKAVKDLETEMLRPDIYSNPARSSELGNKRKDLQEQIGELYEKWEIYQKKLDLDGAETV